MFTPILGNWEELMNGNGEELMNGNEEDEWQLGRVDEGQWGGVDQRQRHGHGERGDEQGRDVVAAPPSESRPVNRGDASVAKELDNEGMWSKIYYVVGPRSERCSKRWSMVSSKIWPRDGHKVSIPTPHPLSNLLPLGLLHFSLHFLLLPREQRSTRRRLRLRHGGLPLLLDHLGLA